MELANFFAMSKWLYIHTPPEFFILQKNVDTEIIFFPDMSTDFTKELKSTKIILDIEKITYLLGLEGSSEPIIKI